MEDKTIIKVNQIREILDNYRIGKKPLARLLGWGETTIIRYIEGDTPTIEYSSRLQAIYNSPCYYYEVLVNNKENLTNVAFRKSRQAVMNKMMESKINVVSQYIINLYQGEIGQRNLQDLLYYVQGFNLALNDVPFFEDDYMVNKMNMPYLRVYREQKTKQDVCMDVSDNLLSENEREMIHGVVDGFGWYGEKTFNAMISFEKSLYKISRDKENNKVIAKDILKSYFKDVLSQYNITEPRDICNYPDTRFKDLKE
jgi:hypothetical protein